MTFPASASVGRLYVESRHRPATQGGGGDIHDVMATPFGVRLLVGDVMGHGAPANWTGLAVLNAWRDLAFTEPSLAGVAVRLHAMVARSEHQERFVTALLANFPATAPAGGGGVGVVRDAVRRAAAGPARPGRRVVPGQRDPGRRRRPAAPVHRRRL
jgi:Stage II sporulation protein E (SpoIIE)